MIRPFAVLAVLAAVTIQPPYVVVRWQTGDCKIWHNDGPGPVGVFTSVAYAQTYPEAFAKLQGLYARRVCL